jgi:hypothetical protein
MSYKTVDPKKDSTSTNTGNFHILMNLTALLFAKL